MNQVCTTCERFSADGNLWCERATCPIDELHPIFSYGEQFGEFKIIRLVRLLPTTMLYEANHQGENVLLKIAHFGQEDYVKREAGLSAKLAGRDAGFLQLRPAYKVSTTTAHPYGKAVFDRRTYYYAVYNHIQGEFLEDMLIKNPMPWYRDAAWIVIQTARLIAILHEQGRVIQGVPLRPLLLIRFDHNQIPRPTVVDFGKMLEINSRIEPLIEIPKTYPPELREKASKATPATDVYSLAYLLSEMLAGRNQQDMTNSSSDSNRTLIDMFDRADLPQNTQVRTIMQQALARDPNQRQQSIAEFAVQIVSIFGKPPSYVRPGLLNRTKLKADWGTITFGSMFAFLLIIIMILAVSR